jgi:hypothetical protein
MGTNKLSKRSSATEVSEFLRKAATLPAVASKSQARLVFALDATASRQPTWDRACQLQGEMFKETESIGNLALQLVWYRGVGDFGKTSWLVDTKTLVRRMSAVTCLGGLTQISRVFNHALQETRQHRLRGLVFVGDCMEEDAAHLYHQAAQLGVLGVPVFMFQEGSEPVAARTFKEIARLSYGVYCPFDTGSAQQLRELLKAAAVYAVGGQQALEALSRVRGGLALQLTHQLKG